jgi:hypothetical protein
MAIVELLAFRKLQKAVKLRKKQTIEAIGTEIFGKVDSDASNI